MTWLKSPALWIAVLFLLMGASIDAAEQAVDSSLSADSNPEQIKAFFESPRYTSRQRTDEQFLHDVYRVILQRDADEKGLADWLAAMKNVSRENVVEAFLQSSEYHDKHRPDTTRNPGNALFDETGVFVNDARAYPADRYASKLKMAKVTWVALQIDNGGGVRGDNAAAIESGWADEWKRAGFKVGFWGCPRGVREHGKQSAVEEAEPLVEADAKLAVDLSVKYRADFYLADVEDSYQGYNQADPAPLLNRVYVEAFTRAASAAGIANIPRALSSMGRVALDMKPWIDAGWDAMPQAYWNAYAVYQPSLCVDFYIQAGWPAGRIHPTIGTFTSEGEKRTVSLEQYAGDLSVRPTRGFSVYLPESYLRNDQDYKALAEMAR